MTFISHSVAVADYLVRGMLFKKTGRSQGIAVVVWSGGWLAGKSLYGTIYLSDSKDAIKSARIY